VKHARGENISGVTYRCRECGGNLGDPEELANYGVWASSVRVHYVQRHPLIALPAEKMLNNLVAAFFIWTTPAGQEMVTTSK
jgi:hypothetical protein